MVFGSIGTPAWRRPGLARLRDLAVPIGVGGRSSSGYRRGSDAYGTWRAEPTPIILLSDTIETRPTGGTL
jgi:hypothetical protein